MVNLHLKFRFVEFDIEFVEIDGARMLVYVWKLSKVDAEESPGVGHPVCP